MRFLSTRGQSPPVNLQTALLRGPAPDGGLYLPEKLVAFPPSFYEQLHPGMAEVGAALLRPFLIDLPGGDVQGLVAAAFDFEVPLVEVDDGVWVLELFHGPTLAFKDVAARFLARCLSRLRRGSEGPLTVLVATSGDTGGAVAQAFDGVEGTRVVVLYPRGRVSELQEKQFTTLGENVQALSVDGSFDDCQRLVKKAFADPHLAERLALSSANSINIGRLLPQMVYYVHAWAQLPTGAPPPLFAVPSGNFGNLTAGLMAHRLGLPVSRFVAATNVNDAVPDWLATGRFRARPSAVTISNAMDVGDPSNFSRIHALYGGAVEAARRDVAGSRHDDTATRRQIRDVYERTGYVLDPHSAVGWLGLEEIRARGVEGTPIVLATAHPIKFREHVEPLIGRAIEVPERLRACLDRPSRRREISTDWLALRDLLLD